MPSAGQVDDDVGARRLATLAILIGCRAEALLKAVLLALAQACLFEQIAQDEFAPVALRFGRAAERRGQIMGLGRELLVELLERFELAAKFTAGQIRIFLRLLDLAAKVVDLKAKRMQQLVEVRLVLLGEFGGFLVEDLAGESLELVGQLDARLRKQLQLFLGLAAFGLELLFENSELLAQGAFAFHPGLQLCAQGFTLEDDVAQQSFALEGERFEACPS